MRRTVAAAAFLLVAASIAAAQKTSTETPASSAIPELNTILMETTFRIQGPKKAQPNSIAYFYCVINYLRKRQHKGQHGSCCTRNRAIRMRRVAID